LTLVNAKASISNTVTAENSGRLTSARFLSLNNGEITELYKASDYSTKEIKKDGATYRVIMQNIEQVIYNYLCDNSYRLIETKHRTPDGGKVKVRSSNREGI
jgi:hypothetical protein